MNPQTIIFIGRSGCGKGTQAKLVDEYIRKNDAKNREIYYLETGAKFREFIKEGGKTSELSKAVYDRDDRQPDFLAIWNWARLLVADFTGEEHLILDGMPRSLPEARVLVNALQFYGRPANIVFLNVSRTWSEKHLLARGRSDDANISKITKRLNWFDSEVSPAVDYFRAESAHAGNTFLEVNGEQGIENVHADIVSKLKIY